MLWIPINISFYVKCIMLWGFWVFLLIFFGICLVMTSSALVMGEICGWTLFWDGAWGVKGSIGSIHPMRGGGRWDLQSWSIEILFKFCGSELKENPDINITNERSLISIRLKCQWSFSIFHLLFTSYFSLMHICLLTFVSIFIIIKCIKLSFFDSLLFSIPKKLIVKLVALSRSLLSHKCIRKFTFTTFSITKWSLWL